MCREKCFQLVATCVDSTYADITAFDDSSRPIKYETFRKYVDVRALEERLGYPPRGWRKDSWGRVVPNLNLKHDYHVYYAKGRFKGFPCVVAFHSQIHHFFVPVWGDQV